jgi:hypothetical protein
MKWGMDACFRLPLPRDQIPCRKLVAGMAKIAADDLLKTHFSSPA